VEIRLLKGIFENQTTNEAIEGNHFFYTHHRMACVPGFPFAIYEQDPAKQPYHLLGVIVAFLLALLPHLYLYFLSQLVVPGTAAGF
jgi:hypothetical protein